MKRTLFISMILAILSASLPAQSRYDLSYSVDLPLSTAAAAALVVSLTADNAPGKQPPVSTIWGRF